MEEIKQLALTKMFEEMNGNHSSAEDVIHNWLCDQEDENLLEGVLKKGRTIKGAMQYCMSQAYKQKSGNAAMVDNQTVFSWVNSYFTSDKVPETDTAIPAKVTSVTSISEKDTPVKKTPKKKSEKKVEPKKSNVEGEQLSLLDML